MTPEAKWKSAGEGFWKRIVLSNLISSVLSPIHGAGLGSVSSGQDGEETLFFVEEFELKNGVSLVDGEGDVGKNGEDGGLSPIPESVSHEPPTFLWDSSNSLKCSERGI